MRLLIGVLSASLMVSVYAQQLSPEAKKSKCQELEDRVKWLDDLGRAGGGGYTMDWIREERRLARDKQFALKC